MKNNQLKPLGDKQKETKTKGVLILEIREIYCVIFLFIWLCA